MSGFKNFIMRGNLVQLAVAVVIGTLYVMVVPVNRLLKLFERNQAATSRDCPECTMSIPIAAQRCPECTAQIVPGTQQPQPVSGSRV